MAVPARRDDHDNLPERPTSGPGRELGLQRRPQLRLALGYRDENLRGAPVKTEYFIPRGDQMIVDKFVEVYGDKPREIDIRLPGSLGGFLEIKHVAFVGGQNEGGGILKAIGSTNFALEGTLGGPDRLTVFSVVETGEVDRNNKPIPKMQSEEIYIEGVDDPQALALGVYLQATISFGIPNVLGFGGACEIRSRGKETIDTLWLTAIDIYGQLGAQASMVLRPRLILKPSTMMTPRGNTAPLWVVDLIVPESLDEVVARLREMREILPGQGAHALYGRPAAIEASPEERAQEAVSTDAPDKTQQAGDAAAPVAAPPVPGTEQVDPPEPGDDIPFGNTASGVTDDVQAEGVKAALFVPPNGKYGDGRGTQAKNPGAQGPKSLAEIHAVDAKWFEWALENIEKPADYVAALHAFTRAYVPEVFTKVMAQKGVQS